MANGAYIPAEYKNNFKPDGSYDYQGAMNNYLNEMNSQASNLENAYNGINSNLQQQAGINKDKVSNEYYGNRQASAYNYKVGQQGLKELMANKGLANSGDNISANINLHNQYAGEQNKLNYEETNALAQIDADLNKAMAENDLAKANKLAELRQQLLDKQMSMDTWYTEYQNTLKQQEEDKRRWEAEQAESKRRWEAEYTLQQQSLASRSYGGGGGGGYYGDSGGNNEDMVNSLYGLAYDPNENFDGRIASLQRKKAEFNANGNSSYNNYIDELIADVTKSKNIYVSNRPQSNNVNTSSTNGYAPYTDGWFKANGYVKNGNTWQKPGVHNRPSGGGKNNSFANRY